MHTQQQQKKNLTYDQVQAWRDELFEGRSLRVTVEDLDSWPLSHYLWAAVFQAVDLHEQKERDEQNWQTPAWDFGRFAKSHPELVKLNEDQALRLIKKTIGNKFWKEHLGMDVADAEMAFDDVWANCRAIPGYDPLTVAILEAMKARQDDDPSAPAGYMVFLLVARSLQQQLGDNAFMLPCHTLAPRLNCLPMTISRYRKKAIRDGYLTEVKKHSFGKGEATEFRFTSPQS